MTVAQGFPLHPPARFFEKPDWLAQGQKLTVVTDGPDAGRAAGYVAPFGQCILDGRPGCWEVPPSPTGYAAAMQGETLTAEGDKIRTANIGGGVNHARLSASFQGAVAHYDNTASQLLRVVYGEDDYGVWCAGAVWDDVTERDLAVIRASALSGDWRFRPELGAFDMSGAQLVNTPGFPHMRRAAGLGELRTLVYVGGMGGAGEFEPECGCTDVDPTETRLAALEAENATLRQHVDLLILAVDPRRSAVE